MFLLISMLLNAIVVATFALSPHVAPAPFHLIYISSCRTCPFVNKLQFLFIYQVKKVTISGCFFVQKNSYDSSFKYLLQGSMTLEEQVALLSKSMESLATNV